MMSSLRMYLGSQPLLHAIVVMRFYSLRPVCHPNWQIKDVFSLASSVDT